MNNFNEQYMDKPLPRDYEIQEESVIHVNLSGLKEKWAQIPHPKLTAKQIKAIRNFAVALVLLLIVVKVVGVITGSENTARKFFKAQVIEANEEAVYDMLDLPEGKFMTKEFFLKINNEWEAKDVTNFEVLENSGVVSNYWGETTEANSPAFIARHNVRYTIRGESDLQHENYQLIKMDTFIPSWKVSTDSLIAKDVKIIAPQNVTITLDGIPLGEEELAAYNQDYYEGYSVYQVSVFAGEHEIYAEAEYMQPQTFVESFYDSGDYFEVPELSLSEEVIGQLQQSLVGVLQETYDAAYNQKDVNALAGHFTQKGLDEFNKVYNNILNALYGNEDFVYGNTIVSDFGFSEPYTYINDGTYCVEMSLQYDYKYSYTYTYYGWFDVETRTSERSSDSSVRAEFVLSDGLWKVDSISMYNIF